ncbi:MAG TPA: choice-of-anchor tandem repeat GloVer-containing protein [Bryobacteraceae bacterium]|nr:choice-of-anchor tandem repeat GloVer-containing protein [Bryobacteraceae bacterium]
MDTFVWWNRVCAAFLVCLAMVIDSPAQTFTTLVSFNGTDGASPGYGALVQGTDGNFYGTTAVGGTGSCRPPLVTCGTVFKTTAGGTLTTLHSFEFTDGATPTAGLIQATDGSFYGTTGNGGTNGDGYGTIFKITPGGTLTTLHSFAGITDGQGPNGLIQATDGNFYGTTSTGGKNGYGTIFKITPTGTLTTLYTFDDLNDGAGPTAALVQAADGNFYGTNIEGPPTTFSSGPGTIFKITPEGTLTTLHNFSGTDGANPRAGLIQATDGNFYGTTTAGGANGWGTVFKITPGGTLTTLYSFEFLSDGAVPQAGLVQATDWNLYGTTYYGGPGIAYGTASGGTIFKITPGGVLTTLHSFAGTDGYTPHGGLVQGSNGNLYGTTSAGGASNDGTIFSLALLPSATLIVSGVLNAASYAKDANGQGLSVAPGSLVQIYATLPGASAANATGVPLPTSLGGVSVTFGGTPAPVSAVAPTGAFPFVNAQVPFEVSARPPVDLVLTVNGVSSQGTWQVPVVPVGPGVFTTAANGLGQAILVNLANLQIASPSNPIPRGGTAFFYATGLGALQPAVADGAASPASPAVATPTVLVGGITAPVIYAGQAPGYPGVNQINITIPQNTPTGNAVPLQIQTADGTLTTSNLVTIAIQ